MSIPKWRLYFSTKASISVMDFLPKFLNFISSLFWWDTRSAKVSMSAALRQLIALILVCQLGIEKLTHPHLVLVQRVVICLARILYLYLFF